MTRVQYKRDSAVTAMYSFCIKVGPTVSVSVSSFNYIDILLPVSILFYSIHLIPCLFSPLSTNLDTRTQRHSETLKRQRQSIVSSQIFVFRVKPWAPTGKCLCLGKLPSTCASLRRSASRPSLGPSTAGRRASSARTRSCMWRPKSRTGLTAKSRPRPWMTE